MDKAMRLRIEEVASNFVGDGCDRCGTRATRYEPLHVVCDDLLCSYCHHQWQKLFTGEDAEGRLLHGPGTRFRQRQAEDYDHGGGFVIHALAGGSMTQSNNTEAELLVQLDQLRSRREFLVSQRTEATKRIEGCDREEQRLLRNLQYLRRYQEASA